MNFYEYKVLVIVALEHLRKNTHIIINDKGLMNKLNMAVRDYYKKNYNTLKVMK